MRDLIEELKTLTERTKMVFGREVEVNDRSGSSAEDKIAASRARTAELKRKTAALKAHAAKLKKLRKQAETIGKKAKAKA